MHHHGNWSGPGSLVVGPGTVFLLIAIFACALLIAIATDRVDWMLDAIDRAAAGVSAHAGASFLWGLSAIVLDVALFGILMHGHVLALLAVVVLLLGLSLVAAGMVAVAMSLGRAARSGEDERRIVPLALGLAVLALASMVPVAGWLVAGYWLVVGTGAILEAVARSSV